MVLNYRSLFYKTHVTPVYTSLHQFAEGLKLFGVLDAIKDSPDIMRTLFSMSGGAAFAWKVEDFLSEIDVVYSPHGSNLFMKEVDTYKYFCDVVEQLSIGGKALRSTLYFKLFSISMQEENLILWNVKALSSGAPRTYPLFHIDYYFWILLL